MSELPELLVAVDSTNSLSGWISLRAAAGLSSGEPFRHPPVISGSHRASMAMMRSGDAEAASIDAVTWELIARSHPLEIAGLHGLGRGPLVPTLPLITSLTTSGDEVSALRGTFTAAVDEWRDRALLIEGFHACDWDDYADVLQGAGAP